MFLNLSNKWMNTRGDYSDVSLGRFSSFAFLSLTVLASELNFWKPSRVGETVQAEFLTFAPAKLSATNKQTNKQQASKPDR